ncbi:MAG: GWxTD domain-containing protein [Bacteroidetes bacterium]|nr:GWxTD domain-containing protein [Bacteroidota bacterium]
MMKKNYCLFVCAVLYSFFAHSNVKAYFNYAVFYAPDKGAYVETYLSIAGPSVFFKKQANNAYQGKVHIEIIFSKNNKIAAANKYNLSSPESKDTAQKPNFIDVQRYPLDSGTYIAEIKISDANSAEAPLSSTLSVVIAPQTNDISLSDIELAESCTRTVSKNNTSKSGYDIVPYPFTSYNENATRLIFYAEGYNALKTLGAEAKFLYNYYIEAAETKESLHNYAEFSKQTAKDVNPLIGQFDVTQLPSGTYNLVVEIRDSKNQLRAQRKLKLVRFAPKGVKIPLADLKTIDTTGGFLNQVSNPDTLRDYIACLWPISSTSERQWQSNQIRSNDVKKMQQYMYAFWQNRNPSNPQLAWTTYRTAVLRINKMYRCGTLPGYMSDRGRVYLQYGAPDAAQQVATEPDSYPYEIWQYYRIKDPATGQFQSNKKFVFMNRELDGHCYHLIHSDARGELRDDRWQVKLKQRNNPTYNFDDNAPAQSSYGDWAKEIYNNPR